MKKQKYYYIKVKEYIKNDIHNGFYDIGYFTNLDSWFGVQEDGGTAHYLATVSVKELSLKYKYKAYAEKRIKKIVDLTKNLKYYYPYEDNIYKYKFEIVEE